MTKQRPCATSLPPSKLCRLLIITFAFKLCVLGMLILEPALPGMSHLPPFSLFMSPEGAGQSTAVAATGEGAGAPPSLPAELPDAGMSRREAVPSLPGLGSGQAPGAAPVVGPGSAAPQSESGESTRALPAIGAQPAAQAPGAANATAPSALSPDTRDALARRQEDLARKEQELRVLESELASRLERMRILENRLAEMIKDAEEAGDAKFRHLVDVLSNMKSKQAAAVLETLDPKIAVRVLAGMRGRQAGEILTFVKPEVAAQLSESLARMQLPLQ